MDYMVECCGVPMKDIRKTYVTGVGFNRKYGKVKIKNMSYRKCDHCGLAIVNLGKLYKTLFKARDEKGKSQSRRIVFDFEELYVR